MRLTLCCTGTSALLELCFQVEKACRWVQMVWLSSPIFPTPFMVCFFTVLSFKEEKGAEEFLISLAGGTLSSATPDALWQAGIMELG